MTTNQPVTSTWYLNGANQNNNTQAWSHTWDTEGQNNVTYDGSNGNGSVSIMISITIQRSRYLTGSWYREILCDDLNLSFSLHFFLLDDRMLGEYDVAGVL
ncbi:MAG: hypothetical protein KKA10_00410 [Euryarchaeota archaeon]|nr:hypothetical protein [Euryarchaeota archaeon]